MSDTLFKPNVVAGATLFAESNTTTNTPATIEQTSVVTRSTAVVTNEQIESLGVANSTRGSDVSKRIMSSVRASDTDTVGAKLNELISTAKGMDPNKMGKDGLLSKLTNMFGNAKEKLMAQYQTVEDRMNVLVGEIDKSAQLMDQRVNDMEQMYIDNENAYKALQIDIDQGTMWAQQLKQDLASTVPAANGFDAQHLADKQDQINRLEKVVDDLERGQQLHLMAAPEIRLMQANARALSSSFKTIKTTTIPAWQGVFSRYILSLEQKKGAEIATSVYDATDEAFKTQADQMRQNTNDIARVQQRSVVSTDTLIHMQEQLLGAVDDALKIAEEGRKARDEARPKLKQMEQQLISRFSTTTTR